MIECAHIESRFTCMCMCICIYLRQNVYVQTHMLDT